MFINNGCCFFFCITVLKVRDLIIKDGITPLQGKKQKSHGQDDSGGGTGAWGVTILSI